MTVIYYIGLDVHKKTISYCIKTAAGQIVREGRLEASRSALRAWAEGLRVPWHGAMEATLFSAWIYDTLKPYAEKLVMGHPARMKAISAGKKKCDRIDARTIADLLRCNLLPTCYVLPPELRDLRRLLRYRNLVVQESVRMQNKMEVPTGLGPTRLGVFPQPVQPVPLKEKSFSAACKARTLQKKEFSRSLFSRL